MINGMAFTSDAFSGTPLMMSLPAGPRPLTAALQGVGTGEGGKDDLGAAQLLQFGRGVLLGAVDVNVRAELLGKRSFVFAARDGHGAIAAFGRVLHAEMAQAADAEDGDGVAGARAAVAQAVEGGDAGAQQRAGIDRRSARPE